MRDENKCPTSLGKGNDISQGRLHGRGNNLLDRLRNASCKEHISKTHSMKNSLQKDRLDFEYSTLTEAQQWPWPGSKELETCCLVQCHLGSRQRPVVEFKLKFTILLPGHLLVRVYCCGGGRKPPPDTVWAYLSQRVNGHRCLKLRSAWRFSRFAFRISSLQRGLFPPLRLLIIPPETAVLFKEPRCPLRS